MDFQTFHAGPEQAKSTLATALKGLLPDRSWSKIKQLIAQRRVQVNGNLCVDEGRKIKAGDVIRVSRESLAPPIAAQDVRIVYVDDDLVVIDKPPGITTLRHHDEREFSDRRKQLQATLDELVDELLAKSQRKVAKARAVHRLDRDTSGLMVFARSPAAETHLIRQFKKHTIERAYIAIALGQVAEQTIESHFIRDRGDGLRGSTTDAKLPDAERAVTHVKPLEILNGYTAVECRLETGRTHQIRIHLAEHGHMLCGEKTYVRPLGGVAREDISGAKRQMLHAAVLGFIHPTSGQPLQFVSPLPGDMLSLLEKLRRARRVSE